MPPSTISGFALISLSLSFSDIDVSDLLFCRFSFSDVAIVFLSHLFRMYCSWETQDLLNCSIASWNPKHATSSQSNWAALRWWENHSAWLLQSAWNWFSLHPQLVLGWNMMSVYIASVTPVMHLRYSIRKHFPVQSCEAAFHKSHICWSTMFFTSFQGLIICSFVLESFQYFWSRSRSTTLIKQS